MDLIREFLLEAFPNPDRIDCPDEETLMALAKDGLPFDHPACLHVGSCSECFREYCGCCLELEDERAGITKRKKEEPSEQLPPPLEWSQIASSLGRKQESPNLSVKAVQRLRERIAAYRTKHHRPLHIDEST